MSNNTNQPFEKIDLGPDGIWTNTTNPKTGENSLKTHEAKPVKKWCAKGEHDFIITDTRKRLAVCDLCDQEMHFIVGIHQISGDRVVIT